MNKNYARKCNKISCINFRTNKIFDKFEKYVIIATYENKR